MRETSTATLRKQTHRATLKDILPFRQKGGTGRRERESAKRVTFPRAAFRGAIDRCQVRNISLLLSPLLWGLLFHRTFSPSSTLATFSSHVKRWSPMKKSPGKKGIAREQKSSWSRQTSQLWSCLVSCQCTYTNVHHESMELLCYIYLGASRKWKLLKRNISSLTSLCISIVSQTLQGIFAFPNMTEHNIVNPAATEMLWRLLESICSCSYLLIVGDTCSVYLLGQVQDLSEKSNFVVGAAAERLFTSLESLRH